MQEKQQSNNELLETAIKNLDVDMVKKAIKAGAGVNNIHLERLTEVTIKISQGKNLEIDEDEDWSINLGNLNDEFGLEPGATNIEMDHEKSKKYMEIFRILEKAIEVGK
jgi:hypothetical protein